MSGDTHAINIHREASALFERIGRDVDTLIEQRALDTARELHEVAMRILDAILRDDITLLETILDAHERAARIASTS